MTVLFRSILPNSIAAMRSEMLIRTPYELYDGEKFDFR